MDRTQRLAVILTRLARGDDPVAVRQEAREFLASLKPQELSFAEQKLVDAGVAPEDLRHLCSTHMEMLGPELEKMKKTLGHGHVIRVMMEEHEKILEFLDDLDRLNSDVQASSKLDSTQVKKLSQLAANLLGAEPHHKREEDVLFPELEKMGVTGPPAIMLMEHEDLRRRKKELSKLSDDAKSIGFAEFKKRLDSVTKFIVAVLRDHIFKENNILYPTAVKLIDKERWKSLKNSCDKIGYCSFTPRGE